MASLDWAAIRTAIVVGLATIGSVIAVASLLTDDPSPAATAGFLVAAAVGFLATGAVAGLARADRPMLHGVVSAGITVLVLLAVGAARSGSTGDHSFAASGLAALTAVLCGVAGALGADWFRRRRLRPRLGTMDSGESAGWPRPGDGFAHRRVEEGRGSTGRSAG